MYKLLDQVSKEQIVKLLIRTCKHALLKASTPPKLTSKKKLNSGAVNIENIEILPIP